MADAWGGSWGVSWGISWGTGTTPATTTDTHDGGDYDEIRRRVREAEKAQEYSARKRRDAEQKLADELETAYRRVVLNEPEIAAEVLSAVKVAEPQAVIDTNHVPQIEWRRLQDILDTAAQVLAILERDRALAEYERLWTAADEDDVEILLLV